MKNLGITCGAVALFVVFAGSVSARELSKSTLGNMGLGGMSQLSDNDGLVIRGKGTSASVWGQSTAHVNGASSSNGYVASSSHYHGSSLAAGANISAAASYSHHGLNIAAAGGASFAYAK